MGTREIFKQNLKLYRKQKGLSQEKLSELIGYGVTYITELETRDNFPKPETIDLIAEQLGILSYQLFMPQELKPKADENIVSFVNDLRSAFDKIQAQYFC